VANIITPPKTEKLDTVEEEKNVKNQTTTKDNLDLQSTSDDDRIKSDDQLWDFNPNPQDSDFQDSQRVKKYDSEFDFDQYDFYDGHDMKYQDTVSDYPIYTAFESRPDVWTPSFGLSSSTEKQITEEVQIEHSKEALNENITENFINEQKEDNSSKFNRVVEDVKDSQNSNNGNGTVAEKQGDLISNDTLRQVEGKPDEISGTAKDTKRAMLLSLYWSHNCCDHAVPEISSGLPSTCLKVSLEIRSPCFSATVPLPLLEF
jgi:uncharacterized protein YjbJ (UPF0337 family)